MVKRILCMVLVLILFCLPVMATKSSMHPNSLGSNTIEPSFVGFGYFSAASSGIFKDFHVADDGVISKVFGSASSISTSSYPYLYFFYSYPYVSLEDIAFEFDITISSPDLIFDSAELLGATVSSLTDVQLTTIYSLVIDNCSYSDNMTYLNLTRTVSEIPLYDYLVVQLHVSSSSFIDRSISFSESASLSGSYSGSWNVNSLPSSSYSPWYAGQSQSSISLYSKYALFQKATYDGVDYFFINRASGDTTSSNPFTMLFQGSNSGTMSLSDTGTISASDLGSTMVYSTASLIYGNDGGLVDEVFDQGETLDDIAEDMQQVIDDMNAKTDTANDIGTATSEDTITGTQETMSSGMSGLSSGLEVVQDMASISAPASGYIGLLTATVTPILNFGNGVLYWALFAVIIGSVILFILRRLQ